MHSNLPDRSEEMQKQDDVFFFLFGRTMFITYVYFVFLLFLPPPPFFIFERDNPCLPSCLARAVQFSFFSPLTLIIDSITTKVLYRDDFTNFNERSVGRRFAKSFQKDSSCSGSWIQKKKKMHIYKRKKEREMKTYTRHTWFFFFAHANLSVIARRGNIHIYIYMLDQNLRNLKYINISAQLKEILHAHN